MRINQDKLNPYFLAMYLNSSDGQEILKQIQTGSVIISINPSKLSAITISTIPFEEQVKLAKRYKLKQEQMVLAKENIKKLEDEYDNFYDNEVKAMFDK